jgi:hypothetical protein
MKCRQHRVLCYFSSETQNSRKMKTRNVAIIGIALCLFVLLFYANQIESGDGNAVLMYLVVFLIPIIILAILNAFYLYFVEKYLSGMLKIICSIFPIILLSFLSLQKNITIPFLDGNLSFLTTVCAIGLGIPTIICLFSSKTNTEAD